MYRVITTMMIFALGFGLQSGHAATSAENVPSRVVHFSDLDLSRTADVAVLYQRLKGAARAVCAPLDIRKLERYLRYKACVQSAISTAVAKVDRPELTTYYEAQRSGHKSTIQTAQNQAG